MTTLTRQAKRLPFVFHRNGESSKFFRPAYKAAASRTGQMVKDEKTRKDKYEGITPHDMRRSGVRNFTKTGLGESEDMSISGHKTNGLQAL